MVPLSQGAAQMVAFYDNAANIATWNDIAVAPGSGPIYLQQARANVVQPTPAPAVNISMILAVLTADHTQVKMVLAVYSLMQNSATGENMALGVSWDAPAGSALTIPPGYVVSAQFLLGSTANLLWGQAVYA